MHLTGFVAEIKKPFNLVMLAIAVASIAVTVVLAFALQKSRGIAYSLPQDTTVVYDSKKSCASIRVLDKDSSFVRDNVYVTSVTLWNSGDLPIEPSDIRKPVKISLTPCGKILDCQVTRQTNPEVANLRAAEVTGQTNNTWTVQLLWDHFDPGMGAVVQIIYAGDQHAATYVDGMIAGVAKFERNPEGRNIMPMKYAIASIALFLYLAISFWAGTTKLVNDTKWENLGKATRFGMSVGISAMAVATLGSWFMLFELIWGQLVTRLIAHHPPF